MIIEAVFENLELKHKVPDAAATWQRLRGHILCRLHTHNKHLA